MIRILIVDDVEAVRLAVAALVNSVPELTVVGTCSDGSEAVASSRRLRPDVVLMDVSMAGVDGITATSELLEVFPDLRVLILTGTIDGWSVQRARDAGAVGYLLKSGEPDELVAAVFCAAAGGEWWGATATDALRHAT